MQRQEMEARTKEFALTIIRFVSALPRRSTADVIGQQLLRCGTSIGANYREAGRAESHADFMHKIGIVTKEASETHYWLELCHDVPLGDPQEVARLLDESNQLVTIFTAMGRTAKSRHGAAK